MKYLNIFLILFIASFMLYSLSAQTYDKAKYQNNPEIITGLEEPFESRKYAERDFHSTGTNWQNPMILDLTEPVHFPHYSNYSESFPVLLANGQILMVWASRDTLKCSHSTDGGLTWNTPIVIISGGEWLNNISGVRTTSGRVLAVWRDRSSGLQLSYSDDNGINWSAPASITSNGADRYTNLTQTLDGKLWLFYSHYDPSTQYDIYYQTSTDDGLNWSSEQTFAATTFDERFGIVVSSTFSTLLAFYVDDSNGN